MQKFIYLFQVNIYKKTRLAAFHNFYFIQRFGVTPSSGITIFLHPLQSGNRKTLLNPAKYMDWVFLESYE